MGTQMTDAPLSDTEFFPEPHLDRMFALVLQLLSEVDRTRARLAALELLLDQHGVLAPAEVDSFRPTEDQQQGLDQGREAMLDRVFRVICETGPPEGPLRAEWEAALARLA